MYKLVSSWRQIGYEYVSYDNLSDVMDVDLCWVHVDFCFFADGFEAKQWQWLPSIDGCHPSMAVVFAITYACMSSNAVTALEDAVPQTPSLIHSASFETCSGHWQRLLNPQPGLALWFVLGVTGKSEAQEMSISFGF